MQGNEDDDAAGPPSARLDRLLARIVADVGAHIGVTYLLVPERQLLQMVTEVGAPRRLAQPWASMALATPAPLAEAVRSQAPVWVPDQQELARRFPRAALAFPYSVAMYILPLVVAGESLGALMLMWPGNRPGGLTPGDRARTAEAAGRMTAVLEDAAARGRPLRPQSEPRLVEPPSRPDPQPAVALLERLTEGFLSLDLRGRISFLSDRAVHLLGRDRAELLDAELWEALPWLGDPAHENAFVAAIFNRTPTGFSARRPDGAWLSFLLHPDATGISVRIMHGDALSGGPEPVETSHGIPPARAGTLFHLLNLASALTEAAAVSEVAESLMGQMRPALDAQGLALLIADEGRMRVAGSRGFPPGMAEYFDNLPMAVGSEGTRTVQTGVPGFHPTNTELVRTFPEHRHYQDMAAFAFLPLTISGGTFGCLVLGYDRQRPFAAGERAELTSLAGMIAQALERARLYDANARVARGLQDGLLPRHLPEVPGIEVAARYRPATHALDVGGDFYDLIDFGEQGAAAVIGDVQGHSVQAAALMGQIRTAVHSHARSGAPPEEILARTNDLLLELNSELFCSCLYAHLDVPGRRVLMASAGHPPPILRDGSRRTDVLDLPPGMLLGVEKHPLFETVEVPLPPGALLALYTDGLVERPGVDLGLSIDVLAGQLTRAVGEPLGPLADSLVKNAEATAVAQSSDDIALMLLECRGT